MSELSADEFRELQEKLAKLDQDYLEGKIKPRSRGGNVGARRGHKSAFELEEVRCVLCEKTILAVRRARKVRAKGVGNDYGVGCLECLPYLDVKRAKKRGGPWPYREVRLENSPGT